MPDDEDRLVVELCQSVALTELRVESAPAPGVHVGMVREAVTEDEVRRIATRRIVAAVQYQRGTRVNPGIEFPRDAGGEYQATIAAAESDLPAAVEHP